MPGDYERERAIYKLTTGKDLPYGQWKSRTTAGAQMAQRQMWGEYDSDGRRR